MTELLYETLAPGEISESLRPRIEALDLEQSCQQLAEDGWTVLENATTPEFNDRLRETILALASNGGANMLLAKDPIFAEVILNPALMAMAEFSVGRGFLISQVAASVRPEGAGTIGLHADHNWLPAPFPVHNMLLTACWACDEYSEAAGATLIIPGSNRHHRHPNADEIKDLSQAVAIECPPGSIAMWDGNLWHSNYPRTLAGERVVCHITYTRLMMRQVEDYSAHAEALIAAHGDAMASMLGKDDMLFSPTGADYSKLAQTFNNAKR
jgi:hypothetical protein